MYWPIKRYVARSLTAWRESAHLYLRRDTRPRCPRHRETTRARSERLGAMQVQGGCPITSPLPKYK